MKRGVETALQKFTRRQFSVKQFKVRTLPYRLSGLHGHMTFTDGLINELGERSKIPRIEELYNHVI